MRYADGPTVEAEVLVDAPIERVWEEVSDINAAASFSVEFLGADWLDSGPRVGARFRGRNHHPAMGEWETVSVVTRYEPPNAFCWSVTDAAEPSSTWWFLLDEADGKVRLRHGGRMGPAPSGLSIAITAMPEKEERIVARRLEEWERNVRATLEGIKGRAEGTAEDGGEDTAGGGGEA